MLRAVVADDEETIRNGLKRLIESSGSGVTVVATAEDGEEALRLISEYRPELAFMDINMPRLDGLDAIRRIREINKETVVIIISGYGEFEYAQRAMSMGVFAYLLKPIDFRNFNGILRSAAEACMDRIWEISQIEKRRLDTGSSLDKGCRATEYVRRSFTDNSLTLSSVSERFGVSCSYLTRIMKQKTGCGFSDYLGSLRVSAAERLLAATDYNVSQISDMVGYSTLHYFSRAFKNRTGLSPNAYRRARSGSAGAPTAERRGSEDA